MALLNPRVLIAAALLALLSFTHFASYRHGKQIVRAEWTAAVAQANLESRALEQRRQRRADEAAALAASREAGIRADAARARNELGGLRGDLDAIERASANSLATANNAVRVLGDVFQSCSSEYQRVAEEADRATSEVKHLREAWPR